MRIVSSLTRLEALALVAVLLVSCGSNEASSSPAPDTASPTASAPPSPTASPEPSPTAGDPSPSAPPPPASPTATPPSSTAEPDGSPDASTYQATGELRDVLFALDGRIVVTEKDWATEQSRVVVLDEHGTVLPGWPWAQDEEAADSFSTAALGPDGSVYVAVRVGKGVPRAYSQTLHRLDADGRELAGFPQALPEVPFCSLATATDGVVYVACEDEDETTGVVTGLLRAVRPDGSTVGGWPVTFTGGVAIAGFRRDGGAVILTRDKRGAILTVLHRNGTVADGWPRSASGVEDVEGVVVDGRDRIHLVARRWNEGQCAVAIRTRYTVLRPDGSPVPGWPVTIDGWASDPLIGSDGSTTIVTDAGRAIRYGRGGRVQDGWPVRRVPVSVACFDGPRPVSAGADGNVVADGRHVTLLTPDGRYARGWPIRLPRAVATKCFACTPGPGGPLDPAVTARGIWLGAYRNNRPQVMGVDRAGNLPGAWQRRIGDAHDAIEWIRAAPNGRVWAQLTRYENETESTVSLLVPLFDDRPLKGS